MIMRVIPFIILFWGLINHAVSGQNSTEKFSARQFVSASGDTLNYRIFIPEQPDSTGTFPLVLFLHGAGERGNDNKAQLKWGVWRFVADSVQQEHPSIIVAPQAPKEQYWGRIDWRDDLQLKPRASEPLHLAYQLIDSLQQEYKIDSNRLYISGLSMGGFGTWEMLIRHPNKFAAGIPVCGGGDVTKAHTLAHIPIWAFHGAMDDVVPPRLSREMITGIQYAGGHPGYTEYPDVNHASWIPAYREPLLMDWLFSKSLNQDKGE